MGHKINPLIFRLGNKKNNWQFNFKEKKNWTSSFLIYQLVSNQMMRYTSPYFNRESLRNSRLENGLVQMAGENQLIKNNFIKKSILFSHLLVGSVNSILEISCFFYDYRLNNPTRYSKNRNRNHKFYRYNQLYSNSFLRWKARASLKFFRRFRRLYKLYRFKPRLRRKLAYFFPNFWFLNLKVSSSVRKGAIVLKTRLFLLLKVFLRLFKLVNTLTNKKKTFFFNVFVNLFSTGFLELLNNLGMPNLRNRIMLLLLEINIFNLNHKLRVSQFFSDLFRNRYFLFKGVSKSIGQNLKSMLPVNGVTIKYHAIKERNMTSSLLTNLIIVKLGQYFRINSIIYPLTNWIRRHKNVLGYRIIISGRLTRRERASHMLKSSRSMPLSSLNKRIDYHHDVKIMKFGMVGIKVYLFVKKKLRNSYYFFKFQV